MACQDGSRRNYSAWRRRLVACMTSTASVPADLCLYLYSDRVGLREGGGRGEPLPHVCARARLSSAPVLSGSIAPTLVHGAAALFARFSSNSCAFRDLMD